MAPHILIGGNPAAGAGKPADLDELVVRIDDEAARVHIPRRQFTPAIGDAVDDLLVG
jgi:hypothetical protein